MIVSPLNCPSPRCSPDSRPSRAAPDAAPDAAPIAVPTRIVRDRPGGAGGRDRHRDGDDGDGDGGDVLPLRTGLAVADVVERLDRDRCVAGRVEEVDRVVGGVRVRRRRRPPCPASATAGRGRGTGGSPGRTDGCRARPARRPRRRSTRATGVPCDPDPPPHASATVNGRHVTRPCGIDAARGRGVDGDDRARRRWRSAGTCRSARPSCTAVSPAAARRGRTRRSGSGARRRRRRARRGAVAPDVDDVAGAAGPDAATTPVVLERRDQRLATGRVSTSSTSWCASS